MSPATFCVQHLPLAVLALCLGSCTDEFSGAKEPDLAVAGAITGSGGNPSTIGGVTGSGGDLAAAGAAGAENNAEWVTFSDDGRAFETHDVYDANREVVRFHATDHAMVALDGTSVSGWTATGSDLAWNINPVAFRVLFGFENGERRAYFTETRTGTICDLRIAGPDQLSIFATDEPPPSD